MGYTHYWDRNVKPEPKEAFGRLLLDARRITDVAKAEGIELTGWSGDPADGEMELNEGCIRLNGLHDESHETFHWPAVAEPEEWQLPREDGSIFTFCKTARKPYDAVVGSLLIRAKLHYGDSIRVSSDGEGEWGTSEGYWSWDDVRDFYRTVFGEEPVMPFEPEEVDA